MHEFLLKYLNTKNKPYIIITRFYLSSTCSDSFKSGDPGQNNFSIPKMEKDPAFLALPKAYQVKATFLSCFYIFLVF